MGQGLNSLSTKSEGSEKTLIAQQHFLDYCYWNPDAVKLYKASDMILFVDSDASYLTAPGSKSLAGGFFYLGNKDESIINFGLAYHPSSLPSFQSPPPLALLPSLSCASECAASDRGAACNGASTARLPNAPRKTRPKGVSGEREDQNTA